MINVMNTELMLAVWNLQTRLYRFHKSWGQRNNDNLGEVTYLLRDLLYRIKTIELRVEKIVRDPVVTEKPKGTHTLQKTKKAG